MTRLEHSVVIQKSRGDVYDLARDVERYPDFLPGYVDSRIIGQLHESVLLMRSAIIEGKSYQWKSWVRFEKPHAIHFEHAEGPLKGMQVEWRFEALSPSKTRVTIIHRLDLKYPPVLGVLREQLIYKPKLNAIAAQVVEAFKRACEQSEREAVRT